MPIHPLEPLSASEIQNAVKQLEQEPFFTKTTRIISVMLKEPCKACVYAWNDGSKSPTQEREALAVILDNATNKTGTGRLNLPQPGPANYVPAPPHSQPTLSMDEQVECEQAVLSSDEFKAALKKHYGVTDTSLVMV